MKTYLIPFGAALTLALFVTGCESDGGVTARTQEKSAAYAALKPWEKKDIDKGVVSTGFTPDMVYMAVGNPSKVEPVRLSDGSNAEMWTYNNYYPTLDAAHARYATYSPETMIQPSKTVTIEGAFGAVTVPAGQTNGSGKASVSVTGGPQGGSMEPASLQAYTFMVLFQDGKVIRMSLKAD